MRHTHLLFLFLLLFSCQDVALAEMVAVAGEDINMRSGPGTKNEVLWKMGTGFPLEVMKRSGDWIQVRDFEGSVGWVQKNTVNKKPHLVVKANKGSNASINVRSEPNTKAKVVAQAKYGVVFRKLEKKGDWIKVELGQGVTGWVDTNLLWGF
jgi:SH3-like domain-containing protein